MAIECKRPYHMNSIKGKKVPLNDEKKSTKINKYICILQSKHSTVTTITDNKSYTQSEIDLI